MSDTVLAPACCGGLAVVDLRVCLLDSMLRKSGYGSEEETGFDRIKSLFRMR